MIVKLIRMRRGKGQLSGLRDNIFALTRYVVDADPWSMAVAERDQIRSLTEYLFHARGHGVEPGEKAGHVGTRNLLSSTLEKQQAEMLATASGSPRVEYPMAHIVVSWPAGEIPGEEQLDDVVDIILSTAGLSGCQALYAEHTNTAHRHLHIAVGRVDPVTGCAAGSEWMIEDLHQAIAIIEERHGWAAEPDAVYYARNGAVYDARARRFVQGADGEKTLDPKSERLVRAANGEFIAARDRRNLPPDVLNARADIIRASREAKSWPEFHQLLDAYDVGYRIKGSGARVYVEQASAKASNIAAHLARKQLESIWGPFIPHPRDHHAPFEAYRKSHAVQLAQLRSNRAAAQDDLRTWRQQQLATIAAQPNRILERAIQSEHDAAQKALDAAFAAAIRQHALSRHTTVERWRAAGSPEAPEPAKSPMLFLPPNRTEMRSALLPGNLRAERDGWATRYYDRNERLVFTDHRVVIIVHRPSDIEGLDTSLQMAAARWGTVQVRGSMAFRRQCAQRAIALGIKVVDSRGKSIALSQPVPLGSPEGARAAPSAAGEQQHTEDPVRVAKIKQVIADLQRMGNLPLRRQDHENSAAPLELVVEVDRFDPKKELKVAALFDQDPDIQAFLEKRRRVTIDSIERYLVALDTPLDKKSVVEACRGDGLGRAAFLAFDDADFRSMLGRVALDRAERLREAKRRELQRRRRIEAVFVRNPILRSEIPEAIQLHLAAGELWITPIEDGVRFVPMAWAAHNTVQNWIGLGKDGILRRLAFALASIEPPNGEPSAPDIIRQFGSKPATNVGSPLQERGRGR